MGLLNGLAPPFIAVSEMGTAPALLRYCEKRRLSDFKSGGQYRSAIIVTLRACPY